ncbi:MAG: hypothetical protein J6V08_01975, partial [Candidatus Methanomethylophilaceae archaeon]|nr:hypothetical protein [Candidatus Methanomethylophilaceae archaeon]
GSGTKGNNYVVTFNYGKLVIDQMDLTIYGETAEVVYNGGTITLSGISSTGLASGDTGSGLVYSATGKDVGTYGGAFTGIIEIRNAHGQVVTGSYNIVRIPGTLTIVPKALDASMVEITSGKLTYNAASQNVGFTVSDGTALVASDYTVEGFSGVDAKGYELVVTATSSGNYSGSVTVGWSIDKAPLTINGMVKTVSYNGAEQNARDVSAIGLMAGHTVHGIYHNALGTNVGTYAGVFDGTLSILENASKEVVSNYVVTYVPGSLTIEALDIGDAVVTQGVQLVYNGIARTPDIVSVNVGGLDVTYQMEYESKIDAGSYTLTIIGKGNFTGSKVVEWTIAKAPLTITAKDMSVTYEDDAPVYDVVYNGFINGDNAGDLAGSLVLSCGYAPNAAYSATFDIVPSGLTSDNYDIIFVKGTLTVSKKVIPIPVAVNGLIYEGEPLTGVPAGYGYGIVGNVKTNVGNYVANVTLLNQGYVWSDHTSVVKNIGWSIAKRTIMVTTPSDSKVYDGTPLTASGTIVNAIEGEYTFTTVGTITDAGSIVNGYSLVWAPGFSASNYSITENLGTLTVQKREITVETYGETKVYDAIVLDKGGIVNGLVAGESVTLNTPNTILDVGSVRNEYTITWDNAKEGNYRIVSETIGTLTIEYRPITVSLVSG